MLTVIVPPEQAASYGAIIDLILAKSDLEKISAKAVRRELGERLGYDVSAQKVRTIMASKYLFANMVLGAHQPLDQRAL